MTSQCKFDLVTTFLGNATNCVNIDDNNWCFMLQTHCHRYEKVMGFAYFIKSVNHRL